jgi:hypothetical protein
MMSGVIETDPDHKDVTITGVADHPDGWTVQHGCWSVVVSSERKRRTNLMGPTETEQMMLDLASAVLETSKEAPSIALANAVTRQVRATISKRESAARATERSDWPR